MIIDGRSATEEEGYAQYMHRVQTQQILVSIQLLIGVNEARDGVFFHSYLEPFASRMSSSHLCRGNT